MRYADAKAIGVVEAKPKGHTLTGVEMQPGKYLDGLPKTLPSYSLPLPCQRACQRAFQNQPGNCF
jgi:type I restriction enzyme R subunit